jgi:hypothetical protein
VKLLSRDKAGGSWRGGITIPLPPLWGRELGKTTREEIAGEGRKGIHVFKDKSY